MNNTPMTAKEYLSQAYRIDQRINAKLEQAERLRELSRRRTVAYGGERVTHSRNVHRMPPPRAFLAAKQKNGKDLLAVEVYEETWKWLAERNCAQLIPAQILEQYAMAISRWIQCEECITEYGFLAKHPTTGNAIPSPYVAMSQSFSKQANNLWYQIYQVVRENCAVEYRGATPHDDMMERLLTARRGG